MKPRYFPCPSPACVTAPEDITPPQEDSCPVCLLSQRNNSIAIARARRSVLTNQRTLKASTGNVDWGRRGQAGGEHRLHLNITLGLNNGSVLHIGT